MYSYYRSRQKPRVERTCEHCGDKGKHQIKHVCINKVMMLLCNKCRLTCDAFMPIFAWFLIGTGPEDKKRKTSRLGTI